MPKQKQAHTPFEQPEDVRPGGDPISAPQTVDDERENESAVSHVAMEDVWANRSAELNSLLESEIVTFDGNNLIWREGHLEHLARQYVANPAAAERDYHDDLAVARAYSKEVFEALCGE